MKIHIGNMIFIKLKILESVERIVTRHRACINIMSITIVHSHAIIRTCDILGNDLLYRTKKA